MQDLSKAKPLFAAYGECFLDWNLGGSYGSHPTNPVRAKLAIEKLIERLGASIEVHDPAVDADIKADSTMVSANTSARAREDDGWKDNPIFQDGDLFYDGVLHREVPEIDDYCTAAGFDAIGAASCDVRPVFLCGAGAVGAGCGNGG